MTYRRSPDRIAARRQWDTFVAANHAAIAATGIPAACFTTVDQFDEFLIRGHVETLSPTQYDALVALVESYFATGYEWFTPSALQPMDQQRLCARFGR